MGNCFFKKLLLLKLFCMENSLLVWGWNKYHFPKPDDCPSKLDEAYQFKCRSIFGDTSKMVRSGYKRLSLAFAVLGMLAMWSHSAMGVVLNEVEIAELEQLHSVYAKKKTLIDDKHMELARLKVTLESADGQLARYKQDRDVAKSNLEFWQKVTIEQPGEDIDQKLNEKLQIYRKVNAGLKQKKKEFSGYEQQVSATETDIKILSSELRAAQDRYDSRLLRFLDAHVQRRLKDFQTSSVIEVEAQEFCGEDITPRACENHTMMKAERKAKDSGSVVLMESVTEVKNFQLINDEVRKEVKAQLSNRKIIENKRGVGKHYVKIAVTVSPALTPALKESLSDRAAQEFRTYLREAIPNIAYWPSPKKPSRPVYTAPSPTKTPGGTRSKSMVVKQDTFSNENRTVQTPPPAPQKKAQTVVPPKQKEKKPSRVIFGNF